MKKAFTKTLVLTALLCALQHFSNAQTTRYVDINVAVPGSGSSWATAFNNFQTAIDAAGVGDTVLVAKGTYQPGVGGSFHIGTNYIKIFGGFPSGGSSFAQRNVLNNPTILKGNGSNVVIMEGGTGNTEFDGFTVRDGVATVDPNVSPVAIGGGLLIKYNGLYANPPTTRIIKNCIFTNNYASFGGGAVFVNASEVEGTPTAFVNCLFNGNTSAKGGALYLNNYSATLVNCSLYNNISTSGTYWIYGGYCTWNVSFNGGLTAYNTIFDNEVWDERAVIGIQFTHLEGCVYPRNYNLGNSNIPWGEYTGYIDPANGNFHLQCSSAANNKGSNAAVPAYLTKDLAGNDRIRRGTVDAGVFEEIGGDQVTLLYDTICHGTPYVYKGQSLTESGVYSNTYQTYYGCDSVVKLNLNVLPTTSSEVTVITCGGYTANGNTYTVPGTYVSHTTNMYGCDSTITVNLLRIIPGSTTLYVDSSAMVNGDGSSWANAFNSLSDALLAAKYCSLVDTVLVAKGTYQPASGQSFSMVKGVKIFGGFPSGGGSFSQRILPSMIHEFGGGSVLKGNGKDVIHNENNQLTNTAVLDGFTIKDGNAYSESLALSGGITNINASPTITRCAFLNNYAWTFYGGGAIYNNHSSPVISQCVFSGNVSVDPYYIMDGNYALSGYGGAIYSENSSNLVVNNCLFTGNSAALPYDDGNYYIGEGGAIYSGYNASIQINNCVFTQNKAMTVTAIEFQYGQPSSISNSIIYNNGDPSYTTALYSYGATVAVNNCIIGDNSYINQPSAFMNGTGNLFNVNPLFVSPTNNDYRVQPNSPAINAGTVDTTGLGIGNADLLNNGRIRGNSIDIGPYEFQNFYYSTGSNAANTLTNWKTNTDGTGSSPIAFNNLARFTVQSGHTLNATGNIGLDSSALFIQNNAAINNTGTLRVGSLLSNNGSITGSGNTVLNGTMSSQTLEGIGSISNLTIDNNATIAATGKQTITDVLTLKSGTFTTNGNLVLASTASIAAMDGIVNTGSLSGTITAQRYLTAQRAYRLLGHPFASNIALSNFQSYVDITGTGTGLTPGNASAYNYLTGTWKPYVNNTDTWNSKEAMLLFVRGTPGQGIGVANGGYTPNAPILQYKGTINTGNLSYTVKSATAFGGTATGWNAIANPYPAPIDINSIGNITAPGGSGASVYVWNAGKASLGAGFASGGYDFYTLGSPIVIPSWGAFFIKNTSGVNQTIQFSESNKALTTPMTLLRNSNVHDGFMLEVDDAFSGAYWDKLKISFNHASSPDYTDQEDLEKISNTNLDFYSIAPDKSKLAINALPALRSINDTIPLGISTSVNRDFVLKANDVRLPVNTQYYLHDRYKGEWLPITDNMNYAFATNTDTASKGNYRFEIVMKPLPPVVAPNAIVTDKLTVKVTPNPVTNGTVKITYASPEALPITIKIIDALGKTIYSSNKGHVQNGTVDVPTATWNNAVYMIQVSNGKETITQKVVKQ